MFPAEACIIKFAILKFIPVEVITPMITPPKAVAIAITVAFFAVVTLISIGFPKIVEKLPVTKVAANKAPTPFMAAL